MRALAREFDLGGITFFGRLGNIESPEQVAGLAFDVRSLGRETAGVGRDRSGRRPCRPPPIALYGVAADGGARPKRRCGAREEVCGRACGRTGRGWHLARLRARPRHPHQSEESGHRRSGARRKAGGRREARPRHHRRAAARRRRGLRQALSRSRRHRDRFTRRAADRRARAGSFARRSSSRRSRRPSTPESRSS